MEGTTGVPEVHEPDTSGLEKYPHVGTAQHPLDRAHQMHIHELRVRLQKAGIDTSGIVEKEELVELVNKHCPITE